ncbi:APSES transcription factor [Paecilomyces variotii No. 5]|uniref:Cell pattern formation-associated protein stuA n=1 Tax=Byssochlamys spectabilis (strain No. 5 / NBRC 109023) TaxID=1356009 RepID=V5G8C9_BYSSN|nr:APSES transcription factor [Paecilomyces variotii No. 5]
MTLSCALPYVVAPNDDTSDGHNNTGSSALPVQVSISLSCDRCKSPPPLPTRLAPSPNALRSLCAPSGSSIVLSPSVRRGTRLQRGSRCRILRDRLSSRRPRNFNSPLFPCRAHFIVLHPSCSLEKFLSRFHTESSWRDRYQRSTTRSSPQRRPLPVSFYLPSRGACCGRRRDSLQLRRPLYFARTPQLTRVLLRNRADEELLGRRRLGKTNLSVKPAQIGTSNATKPENLGPFEYAHLRAPLPRDLAGSEIFPSHNPTQHPITYFLMRRSKDGFISATGMFKIAFPWAKLDEEKAEREYLKSKKETSQDEIAGNVWISPELALELSKEYRMYDWVRALLDPTDIVQSPSSAKKQISPPPKFDLPPLDASVQLQPPASRTRGRRSVSPSKTDSPSKKSSSPRKSRQTRAAKEAAVAATNAANASLQSALDTAASTADTESVDGTVETNGEVNGEEVKEETKPETKPKTTRRGRKAVSADETVKVDVQSTTDAADEVEATQTTVSVEMPALLPDVPPAEDTEQMIARAKEMVQEATKLEQENGESSAASKKRKSDEAVDEEGEETDTPAQPTKRAKVLEDKLRKERVRNRALVGVTATLALAAAIPYFF